MIRIHTSTQTHPGILFQRSIESILRDSQVMETTMAVTGKSGESMVSVNETSVLLSDMMVTLTSTQGEEDHYIVVDAEVKDTTQTILLNTKLRSDYLVDSVVRVHLVRDAAILYDKINDTFHFCYTTSKNVDNFQHAEIVANNMSLTNDSYIDTIVSLPVSSKNSLPIPRTRTRGVYHVMVNGDTNGTPAASFIISKSTSESDKYDVNTISSSTSLHGETIEMAWPAGQGLHLYHRKTRKTGDLEYVTEYTIKVLSTSPFFTPGKN